MLDLDSRGLLPPGVHIATFAQLAAAFGTTPYRRRLLLDLEAWAGKELPVGSVEAVLIAGSFLSDKPSPDDIDVAVIFNEDAGADPPAIINATAHRAMRAHRIDVHTSSGLFFQFVGEKGAARHGANPTDLRGVVSLSPWHRDTQRIRNLSLLAEWDSQSENNMLTL